MHSLFILTEACAIFFWSRISDQIGRKPAILTGLLGLSASMWCFGLFKTFWALVLCRCLNGALNGNIGVVRGMVIDFSGSTDGAQVSGILPLAWSLGTALGPLIGGCLARPAERFPETFGSAFFKNYPYFLPCSIPGAFTAVTCLVTFACMEKTANSRLVAGQHTFDETVKNDNTTPFHDGTTQETDDKKLLLCDLFVHPGLVATTSYAGFSLVEMAFRMFIPVFYTMPIEMGGLSLDPSEIGIILTLLGSLGGVMQWSRFVPFHDRLGPKPLFLMSVSLCITTIAFFPAINAVARMYGVNYFVWSLVALQLLLFAISSCSFARSFTFMSTGADGPLSIGATNNVAQAIVSVMRAAGPVVVNSAFSFGVEKHVVEGCLGYWVMVGMAGLTLWIGWM